MSLLEGLNSQQVEAVSHRKGPAVVIAGPGAGKTRVLTVRSASLIEEGIAPERILLLTFTRAAAKAMISRARALDERAQFLTAGTFHSWGIKILNANSHLFGLDRPFTMLDEDDVVEIVKKHMDPLKGDKNWPRASTIAKILSYAVNTQSSLSDAIEKKAREHAELIEEIKKIKDGVTEDKIEKGMLSYDDVLVYLSMLLEDEEIGNLVRSKYDYIMVDEYQDTNELQLKIVHGLVGNSGNVMIVGDPSQSIYGFRGGAPATMGRFYKAFPDSKVIPLEINYRSTPEIIALVNAIDSRMDIGFDRTLKSARPSGPKPTIIDVADNAAEAIAIADAILADKAEGGEICEHAILVRSTAAARRIETEFISRKIPHVVKGGVRIDEAAHIKDLLSIARITTNLTHEPAWLRSLSRFRKIGTKAAGDMTTQLIQMKRLDEASNYLRTEAERRKTDLDKLADSIDSIQNSTSIAEGLGSVIHVMRPIWSQIWEDDWKSRERDLEAILLIAEEHPNMESFLTTVTLDGSMDKERVSQEEKLEEDPVTISTIHSAKGLEWKNVHVPAFVQGGMPSLFAMDGDDWDEELRIFYVAASRAEKNLTFYKPRFNGQGNFTSPSVYEEIARPFITQGTSAAKLSQAGNIKIAASKRIDLRERLLKKD